MPDMAGHRADECPWDIQTGQTRTPPYRVSVCPVSGPASCLSLVASKKKGSHQTQQVLGYLCPFIGARPRAPYETMQRKKFGVPTMTVSWTDVVAGSAMIAAVLVIIWLVRQW